MKRIVFALMVMLTAGCAYGQTTYYWVGGTAPTNITTAANWNTALNGTGSPRPSSTGTTDILVFDGTNVGGAVPTVGTVIVPVNGGVSGAQLKFINGATIQFLRTTSGTGTITLYGDGTTDEDFVIESGCSLAFTSTVGSVRIALGGPAAPTPPPSPANTGRVSGNLSMITTFQARIDYTIASGTPGTMTFTSGATFTTNITAASASYGFGNSTQSPAYWVKFQAGSHLYYQGGFSPHGSGNLFSAIDMQLGSTWHQRVTNPTTGAGNFFNRQSYGDIIVENNSSIIPLGSIYRIGNLTVDAGSTFNTYNSGQTAVMGNITVNGTLAAPVAGTNEFILSGNTPQTISGTGTIGVNSLIVANKATATLNTNVSVENSINVMGRMNFNSNQLTGAAAFTATGIVTPGAGTGNLSAGSTFITGNTGIAASTRGQSISGTGIAPNTTIVAFSSTLDSIFLSNPITTSGAAVALSVTTNGSTLETSNANGFDPATGSVAATGNKTYQDNINYVINGATVTPFGISTGGSGTPINSAFIEVNAPVTVNRGFTVSNHLTVNGKLTLRPLDVAHISAGAVINGTINVTNYIATDYNLVTGEQSTLQYDGATAATLLPIGTVSHYLPVTITPTGSSNFIVAVFQGITSNGAVTGTPLTPAQKQTVVDAVWNISRTSGTGSAVLQLGWTTPLEGSTFITLPDTDIGLIENTGSSWALPIGTGDNTANIVTATVSAFGSFSAGAIPPTQPFIFNPLPLKTYGDPDFNGGATSLNTTQPIVYTSSNPAVATIVGGNIHIVGAGSSNITAAQASDGFYPAASVTQPLTVNKANLTITADNKTKFELTPNPTLTATYTGFVLSETPAVLITPVVLSTTAVQASPPGTYPITASGATAANYNITHVNAVLTVQPKQNQTITFNAPATKTYGNADFAHGATSTNTTIPVVLSSSNTAVATINGNLIHIVGAGTSNITASQAGNDGYFPAANVTRTLTVNKAPLTIRVRDTTKVQGQVNPTFTITYTGFVLGETVTNLTTAPQVNTTATTNSAPGYYALTPQGAASANYNFTYTDGRLTIYPPGGTDQQYLLAFMPNSNTLTVRVFSVQPAIGDIVLYDMNGRPLIRRNLYMPPGFINADLMISSLASGNYIVTVRGEGVDLKKVISIIH